MTVTVYDANDRPIVASFTVTSSNPGVVRIIGTDSVFPDAIGQAWVIASLVNAPAGVKHALQISVRDFP